MATIIELDSIDTVKAHANLWNTPNNQLRRAVGRFRTVHVGERCGTVRANDGKYWDWWVGEDGVVTIMEAT